MAKETTTENATEDTLVFDSMPGGDKKDPQGTDSFTVDLDFSEDTTTEDIDPVATEEQEVEEETTEESQAESEEAQPEEVEDETETETVDEAESSVESEPETADEEAVQGDVQQVEEEPSPVEEKKAPMVPKSRLDEVLAKQKALQKQLDDLQTAKVEAVTEAPEYDFVAKEIEYQEHILNGEAEKAAALRTEIRDAERQNMLFEVQERMGKTVQQSTEAVALQNKAIELQTAHPELDETSASYDADLTQEVMDLRDAFMIQGFSGADALDKAAKYVIKPTLPAEDAPKKDVVGEKIVEKKKVANTTKKLEAAESQPPTLKGKNKVEKKIDLDLLSSEEFDALPQETLKRMRGDFG